MSFQAVLDANVLFPPSLRDLLLRLAEVRLFDVRWSEQILDEVERNIVKKSKATNEQAAN